MPFPPERAQNIYSLILAIRPTLTSKSTSTSIEVEAEGDWRLGEITVDWVDFTREKSSDRTARSFVEMPREGGGTDSGGRKKAGTGSGNGRIVPGSAASAAAGPSSRQSSGTNGSGPNKTSKQNITDPDALSLQPLLAHFPSPSPLSSSHASGISEVGRGVVHVFRHAPPPSLIASLNAHPIGEGSSSKSTPNPLEDDWAGDKAEGEDGSLVAILAVPAWMRPADFLEFIGGWGTCLEGVRMIR
jgi:BRCA1-associated protein